MRINRPAFAPRAAGIKLRDSGSAVGRLQPEAHRAAVECTTPRMINTRAPRRSMPRRAGRCYCRLSLARFVSQHTASRV